MKDLERMEREIDALLESETTESLTEWLLNKRYGNLYHILGKGKFVSTGREQSMHFKQSKKKVNYNIHNKTAIKPNKNRLAA